MNPNGMARGLGWFSIGFGTAELAATESLAEALGMEGKEDLIRLYGAREIGSGVACLGMTPPTGAVWSRVAGDLLDIATLAPYLSDDNPKRRNVGIALAAVVGVTILDVLTAAWCQEGSSGPMTRMARRPLERLERQNERRLQETARRGGDFASERAAERVG